MAAILDLGMSKKFQRIKAYNGALVTE